ncbi:peptidase M24A, methionine aminopeptidase [Coprinopsis marcescibilis]|uniref:Methionine aminopeptidase 2 n=1 Tax=Coprinopsis marcescibilis TaxID=230819 RepID=A0A5C3L260_COPMA|nr:peptidase M24A, methionine aminopeptidase [Coprinopsis marcescibilis]
MSKRASNGMADIADPSRPKRPRREGAGAASSDHGDSDAEVDGADQAAGPGMAPTEVRSLGSKLLQAVKEAVDKDGRVQSDIFIKKPSKKSYPDYYEIVQRPIAFEDIQSKLAKGLYPTLQAVLEDFELCFGNAQRYNLEGSQVWNDAKDLLKVANKAYGKLMPRERRDDKKSKPPSMIKLLKTRLQKLVEKTDETGRVLSTEFMELPSRKQWPDYYLTIQQPQCFNNIFKRIKRKEYKNAEEFANDVELIFSNAMKYNLDHTQIWEDALALRNHFRQLMSDLPSPFALPKYSQPSAKIKIKPPAIQQSTSQATGVKDAGPSLTLRVPAASASKAPPPEPTLPVARNIAQPTSISRPATRPTAPVPSSPAFKAVNSPKLPIMKITASTRPTASPLPYGTQNVTPYPSTSYVTTPTSLPVPVVPAAPVPTSAAPVPAIAEPRAPAPVPVVAPAPPIQTATPAPVKVATPVPPNQHQLKCATVEIQPRGRTVELNHRDGVKSWAIRLAPGESRVIVKGVAFMNYRDDEEEESSDEEEEDEDEEDEDDMDVDTTPTKNGRAKKAKGKKRGRPPTRASARQANLKSVKKKSSKPGEIQVKVNSQVIKEQPEQPGEWDIHLPVGATSARTLEKDKNDENKVEEPILDVEEDDDVDGPAGEGENKKKKKKKKPKKKSGKPTQSDPPRVGLSKFFPDGNYPVGEIHEYKDDNAYRITSEEKRYDEKMAMEDPELTYANIRKAAEVHRVVRQHARKWIRPGMAMTDIANMIEDGTRALVEENGLEAGIGFPTGLSLNHCAAHYTPNAGDTNVLQKGDVLKVDIGVQVNGRIADSAFTLNFEPTYDALIEAVKAATETGVREAGIDMRVGELAGYIQETMESYEVEVGGKVYPVKPIANLSGHSINRYQIHGGKSVMLVKNNDQTKMEEGDYFAIETFGSTGQGRIVEGGECSHYAKKVDAPHVPLRLTTAKSLLNTINKNFGTLPFCRRYLDRLGESKYLLALNHLVQAGIIEDYPPLCDVKGSMTAQFEHTLILRPTCKEIVTRGDDY